MKKFFVLSFLFCCSIFAKAQIQSITYNIEDVTPPTKRLKSYSSEQIMFKLGGNYEKYSLTEDSLVFFGKHPFLSGITAAYKEHRPFVISPDMIWLLISQGFARHVNENSEELRSMFVDFEGKKELTVVSDRIFMGDKNSDWESVFPQFESGIAKFVGEDFVKNIMADFTTTTPTAKIASQITLMESVKAYFDYKVILFGCGLPKITIEGTPEDWEKVLAKTKFISKYKLEWWTDELEPILEEIIKASRGKFKKKFWMNMVKIHTPKKYGEKEAIDGWITKFFPFDDKNKRRKLTKITSVEDIASELVQVPFILIDQQKKQAMEYKMEFWAGFMALSQAKDFTLKPQIAWAVAHDESTKAYVSQLKDIETDYLTMRNVTIFPTELLEYKKISVLELHFANHIYIPNEVTKINLQTLYLYGKITEDEEKSIRKRFPRSFIVINGKAE